MLLNKDEIIHDANEELESDEGLRLYVYNDTANPPNPTVGYGHELQGQEIDQYPLGTAITQEQADEWLALDEEKAVNGCINSPIIPFVAQPLPVQCALLNMAFNDGVRGLEQFTTFLGLVHEGQYNAAAADLLRTEAAQQLPSRYGRLAAQIRSAAE